MRYFVGFDPEYANVFTPGKLYPIHCDGGYRVRGEGVQHAHRLTVALEVVKGSAAVEFPE